MTEPLPDPLDDLASAHLDGVTTPAEAARVAGDPALRARVEALRGVRDAVRTADGPVDDGRRDAAIAAALAAFDAGDAPTDLVAAARARRDGRRRAWVSLAAVAAVAAAALVVPRVLDRGGDDTTVAESPRDASAADSAAGSSEAAPSTLGDVSPKMAPAIGLTMDSSAVDLGAVDDLAALAAAARDQLGPTGVTQAPPAIADPDATAIADCFASLGAGLGRDDAEILRIRAVLGGTPVVALVVRHLDGTRTLTAATADGCAPRGSAPV